jgi:hypothetical protein
VNAIFDIVDWGGVFMNRVTVDGIGNSGYPSILLSNSAIELIVLPSQKRNNSVFAAGVCIACALYLVAQDSLFLFESSYLDLEYHRLVKLVTAAEMG